MSFYTIVHLSSHDILQISEHELHYNVTRRYGSLNDNVLRYIFQSSANGKLRARGNHSIGEKSFADSRKCHEHSGKRRERCDDGGNDSDDDDEGCGGGGGGGGSSSDSDCGDGKRRGVGSVEKF